MLHPFNSFKHANYIFKQIFYADIYKTIDHKHLNLLLLKYSNLIIWFYAKDYNHLRATALHLLHVCAGIKLCVSNLFYNMRNKCISVHSTFFNHNFRALHLISVIYEINRITQLFQHYRVSVTQFKKLHFYSENNYVLK